MRFRSDGLILIGMCAMSACTTSSAPRAGSSETHFLLRCSDEVCGEGLSCICGACTQTCSSDPSCGELASGARCMDPEASCLEAKSCDVGCEVNADCAELGADHKCEDGRCRAIDRSYVDTTPPGGPSDAGGLVTYGPCHADGSVCGGSDWFALESSVGLCLCTVSCQTSADCPRALTGTAAARCVFGQDAIDGQPGECDLPCDGGQSCPNGAACTDGLCRFATD